MHRLHVTVCVPVCCVLCGVCGCFVPEPCLTCAGRVQRVSLLYPDPWFKKRHAKRRMLTPRLVGELADAVPERGQMLIETDVKDLADDMWTLMSGPHWREVTDPAAPFAKMEIETERQASVKKFGHPQFRRLYERTDKKSLAATGAALAPHKVKDA